MNDFDETGVNFNKKKNNRMVPSGGYMQGLDKKTPMYNLTKGDGVPPKSYHQTEINDKANFWDANQNRIHVTNSSNMKDWSQYA